LYISDKVVSFKFMANETKNTLEHLGFKRIEPSEPLKAYIDSYWFIDATCTNPQGFQQFLHPDGGMGFIFNYGDSLSFDGKSDHDRTYLDGTNTKTIRLVLTENINAVGIRFKPAGASVFFNTPLHELKDQRVNIKDLNSIHFANLADRISAQEGLHAKMAIIEQVLLQARSTNRIISTRMTSAIQKIKDCQGRLELNSLSQHLNINQRKLERLFKVQLGMTASEFTKTVRAEQARTLLKKTAIPLAEAAYKLGFYDQAHFTKSFKSVVGITPGQYRTYCC